MARLELAHEPMSISVVEHEASGRVSFSDIPARILPALVQAYGPQSVARAIAASPIEKEFCESLPLTSRVRPRYLDALESGVFAAKVAELEKRGLGGGQAIYFMAAINLSDEAALGKTGAIYFVCKKGCYFCQYRHFDEAALGEEALAERMLALQAEGADNIQWVSPTAYTPLLVRALYRAARAGLRIPLVHKGEGEDGPEELELLDGLVDIYLPDAKFIRPEFASNIGLPATYPKRLKACIREMYRQVGPLARPKRGTLVATTGLLVRHLLMPGGVEEARAVFEFLDTIDRGLPLHVMTGYEPLHEAKEHPVIGRVVTDEEIAAAADHAQDVELSRVLFK